MSQKIVVESIDDLDGTEAAETIAFALGESHYEIDLNATNATTFRGVMSPFVTVARPVRMTPTRKTSARRRGEGRPDNDKIRAWAKEKGMTVNDRGRIPAAVITEYEAANA